MVLYDFANQVTKKCHLLLPGYLGMLSLGTQPSRSEEAPAEYGEAQKVKSQGPWPTAVAEPPLASQRQLASHVSELS